MIQETSYSQSSTHSGPAVCDSRQAIHARPDHLDRMVPLSRCLPGIMPPVAPAPNGSFCHQVQQQSATICITGAVDAISMPREDLDPYVFPPVACLGKVTEKLQDHPCSRIILITPGCPNMPWFWVARNVASAKPAQPVDSAVQSDPSQEPVEIESSCLAPRSSAIKEQGFSEAVAAESLNQISL